MVKLGAPFSPRSRASSSTPRRTASSAALILRSFSWALAFSLSACSAGERLPPSAPPTKLRIMRKAGFPGSKRGSRFTGRKRVVFSFSRWARPPITRMLSAFSMVKPSTKAGNDWTRDSNSICEKTSVSGTGAFLISSLRVRFPFNRGLISRIKSSTINPWNSQWISSPSGGRC